ncbi:MAG: NAD(P)-dependent oxidoreductase [Planctomycetota bacterium]
MTRHRKILVTCPPMQKSITRYQTLLAENRLEADCPAILQTMTEDALIASLPSYDGWIIGDDPATARVFAAAVLGRLRGAVKWGVGVDNVDFDGARESGLNVTHTPGMFGEEVADVALAYLIGLARGLFQIDRGVIDGAWPKPVGMSLQGRVCAVVGYGDIGQAIARRLTVCGMHVNAYDPNDACFRHSGDVQRVAWPVAIEEADFVVLSCSLNSQTEQLLDEAFFEQCKPGVRIVNVSRGRLIDEAALAKALSSGRVHSAALEVLACEPLPRDSPLRGFPQLIFGSHNGSNTQEAVDRTSEKAIRLLVDQLGPE